jgi:hypothetical protein
VEDPTRIRELYRVIVEGHEAIAAPGRCGVAARWPRVREPNGLLVAEERPDGARNENTSGRVRCPYLGELQPYRS